MTRRQGRKPVVVVGADGSVIGRHAFEWALGAASIHGYRVRAVHVWSPPASASPIGSIISPVDVQACARDAKELLEQAIDEALASGHYDASMVDASAIRGYAPEVLLEAARSASLLVVGTRGRGGLSGLLLGSVSQHCTVHATSPLVVVPPTALLAPHRDVIVGVDGSPGSVVALRWAIDEAVARDATLRVVHGWWVEHPAGPNDVPFLSVDRHALVERSKRLLQDMAGRSLDEAAQRPANVELVPLERPPARGLVEEAHHAGLLVVGSRGRSSFRSVLLGSVSQQCVHEATCPVAVIPPEPDTEPTREEAS